MDRNNPREVQLAAYWAAWEIDGDEKKARSARWIVRHYGEYTDLLDFMEKVCRLAAREGLTQGEARRLARVQLATATAIVEGERQNDELPPLRNVATGEPTTGHYARTDGPTTANASSIASLVAADIESGELGLEEAIGFIDGYSRFFDLISYMYLKRREMRAAGNGDGDFERTLSEAAKKEVMTFLKATND